MTERTCPISFQFYLIGFPLFKHLWAFFPKWTCNINLMDMWSISSGVSGQNRWEWSESKAKETKLALQCRNRGRRLHQRAENLTLMPATLTKCLFSCHATLSHFLALRPLPWSSLSESVLGAQRSPHRSPVSQDSGLCLFGPSRLPLMKVIIDFPSRS